MSGAMESRAAVFTSSPQDVEVYSTGEWLPGSLLGWRHDATGGCQVWVRLTVGSAEESLWTDLECLRLPERGLAAPVDAVPLEVVPLDAVPQDDAPLEDVAATRSLRLAEVSSTGPSRRGRPAVAPSFRPDPGLTATRGLPVVRDEIASRASHPAGRRRADSRVIGETVEFSAVDAGRHRAPASPSGSGRHRAAVTGVWPVVPADAGTDAAPARSPEERAAEPDLLTRPMRLDGPGLAGSVLTGSGRAGSGRAGSVAQARAARWDDTLSGV